MFRSDYCRLLNASEDRRLKLRQLVDARNHRNAILEHVTGKNADREENPRILWHGERWLSLFLMTCAPMAYRGLHYGQLRVFPYLRKHEKTPGFRPGFRPFTIAALLVAEIRGAFRRMRGGNGKGDGNGFLFVRFRRPLIALLFLGVRLRGFFVGLCVFAHAGFGFASRNVRNVIN